jgi:hypothetical protein
LDPKLDVIGIDLEHMPENFHGVHNLPCTCQLLQVATRNHVFLFDLQLLVLPATGTAAPSAAAIAASAAYRAGFDDLCTSLFDHEEMMKVGMGFEQDWSKLRSEFPHMV